MCYNSLRTNCKAKQMAKEYDKNRTFRLSDEYMKVIESKRLELILKNGDKKISKTMALKRILDEFNSEKIQNIEIPLEYNLPKKKRIALELVEKIIPIIEEEILKENK